MFHVSDLLGNSEEYTKTFFYNHQEPEVELHVFDHNYEEISASDSCIATRGRMVGESTEFLACVDQLNIAASSDAPVLLQGETGTGKELAAEFIHSHSARKLKPFQIVDSTVLTETLFESELFGHEKGAFTGALWSTKDEGVYRCAACGTPVGEKKDNDPSEFAAILRGT